MPEKIKPKRDIFNSFKPTVKPNGRILVLWDEIDEEEGDIITNICNSYGSSSISNNDIITGIIVDIAENVYPCDVSIGDRIASVTNKVTMVQDNGQMLFLVDEDNIIAKLDDDVPLDFKHRDPVAMEEKDDYYNFSKFNKREED